MEFLSNKPLLITDTILRDAHQSQAATRMTLEQMLPACEILDSIGYYSLECWGGATFIAPGFRITDDCTECGLCEETCTHKAIVPGSPYRILGERCDECGNCHHVCKFDAIVEK